MMGRKSGYEEAGYGLFGWAGGEGEGSQDCNKECLRHANVGSVAGPGQHDCG